MTFQNFPSVHILYPSKTKLVIAYFALIPQLSKLVVIISVRKTDVDVMMPAGDSSTDNYVDRNW